MPQCSYVFCSSTRNLHGFPKDPYLRAKWIKFCYRETDWLPGPSAKICREHFTPESYSTLPNHRKISLKKDAVPTLGRGVERQGFFLEGKRKRAPPHMSENTTGGVEYQPPQLLRDQNFEQQPQRTAPMQHQPHDFDHDFVSKVEQVTLCFIYKFFLNFFSQKVFEISLFKRKKNSSGI